MFHLSQIVELFHFFSLSSVVAEDTEDGDSFRRPTSMGPVKLPNSAIRISRSLSLQFIGYIKYTGDSVSELFGYRDLL